jgi:hypothetical protein
MTAYTINKRFLSKLHKRAQAAISEALKEWRSDFRNGSFLHNVAIELVNRLSKPALGTIVGLAIWTSLEREEGHFHPFSLVLEPPNPDEFNTHYKFAQNIELTPANLTKLAPAIDPTDYQIGVWFDDDGEFVIWGFKPKLVWFFSVNSISPGKISVSCISDVKASFKCLVSLARTGFINPISRKSNPIFDWLSDEEVLTVIHKSNDLNSVCSRMFYEGYGGTLLLVPENQDRWRESVQRPPLYEPAGYIPAYSYANTVGKYDTIREFESEIISKTLRNPSVELEQLKDRLSNALERGKSSIADIYKLTTVDGATIVSKNLSVLGFGAKIVPQTKLERIAISEPFEDCKPQVEDAARWNVGTRYKSAVSFVNEQRDCLAIVASVDRKLSIFSWSHKDNVVHQLKGFELFVLG